tara:strand:+ start:630 stop:881 length:252 start_codon:yes stop_codon:yes gene_type:complete
MLDAPQPTLSGPAKRFMVSKPEAGLFSLSYPDSARDRTVELRDFSKIIQRARYSEMGHTNVGYCHGMDWLCAFRGGHGDSSLE